MGRFENENFMWDQEVKLKDDTPDHLIRGLALSVILLFCIFALLPLLKT